MSPLGKVPRARMTFGAQISLARRPPRRPRPLRPLARTRRHLGLEESETFLRSRSPRASGGGRPSCPPAPAGTKRPGPSPCSAFGTVSRSRRSRAPSRRPSASTSRTSCPLASPPIAGLHGILAICSRLIVMSRVAAPHPARRERRLAAGVPGADDDDIELAFPDISHNHY